MKKIAILVYADKKIGHGHIYRSIALANAAEKEGHAIWLLGNRRFPNKQYFQVRLDFDYDLYHVFHQTKPDWLIIDFPFPVPEHIYDLCKEFDVKLMDLNGGGKENDVNEDKADVVIVQGFYETDKLNYLTGPEYVILRPEIEKFIEIPTGEHWFVFGGSMNRHNLLDKFNQSMGEYSAMLVGTHETDWGKTEDTNNHRKIVVEGDAIFAIMRRSKAACITMGMVAWELAYLGVPTYVFSPTKIHLKYAQNLEKAGLVTAYPRVGIPSPVSIRRFLKQDFVPNGKKPDLKALDRILEVIENGIS